MQVFLNTNNADGYIIPSNDEFFQHYNDLSSNILYQASNFSGSNGLYVVVKDKKYLITDGRYISEAKISVEKDVMVVNMYNSNEMDQFLSSLPKNCTITFNPKLHSKSGFEKLQKMFSKVNIQLKMLENNDRI